jgi:hypothetical protein
MRNHPDRCSFVSFSLLFHPVLQRLALKKSPSASIHGLMQLVPEIRSEFRLEALVGFLFHEGRLTELCEAYFWWYLSRKSNVTLSSDLDSQALQGVFNDRHPIGCSFSDLLECIARQLPPDAVAAFHTNLLAFDPGFGAISKCDTIV